MKRLFATVALFFAARTLPAATFTVTNTNDSGPGSLRQAILSANATAGTDSIVFSIGSGPQLITPSTLLPMVTDNVTIDATTQPGYTGTPLIGLDGGLIIGTVYVTGGFVLKAPSSVIGFAITSFRVPNYADGQEGAGVVIGAPGCVVKRCYLGISRDGNTAAANDAGVRIDAAGATIGAPGEGNVISGNDNDGIAQWNWNPDSGATIQYNIIGLNAAGTAAVPNTYGMYLSGPDTISFNTAAGNRYGDALLTGSGIVARANKLGINVLGATLPMGYEPTVIIYSGFGSASNVTLGGPNPGDGNDIGGGSAGVYVYGSANTLIQGNSIRGNGTGVSVDQSTGTSITGNIIHDNAGVAVVISSGAGNRISSNSIYSNRGGIQLGSTLPLPNDPGDGDTGANLGQNFPLLTPVLSLATTTIQGTLNSTPSSEFRLEFFNTPSCDSNGYGEGKTFLTSTNVSTDASGNGTFSVSIAEPLPSGSVVSATATDANGNTSEFSACAAVQGAGTFVFSSPQFAFNENAGNAAVTVSRGGGSAGTASVDYATASGTATAGTDFAATSGTLTFAPGETSKTISIPIIDDALFESNEQFTITLSNATGGATIGTPSTATIIIADNDPPVITIPDLEVIEGNGGPHAVLMTLTAPAPLNGAVNYFTSDGTATAGSDYRGASGSVFFNNETTKTISLTIIGDSNPEPNEFFYVNFYTSGALTVPAKVRVTILNDDVSFEPRSQSIAVGTHALLVVDIGQPVTANQVISVASSDPTVAKVAPAVTLRAGTAVVGVDVTGIAHGGATITATLPAALGGQALAAGLAVYDGASLVFDPPQVQTTAGSTTTVTASLSPAQNAPAVIPLKSANTAIVTVPATITIPPGGSVAFSVNGIAAGGTFISAALPSSNGGATITLPVNVDGAPKGLAIAQVSPANGPTSGGTSVSLTGANFGGGCVALFGGVPATTLSTTSPTTITATTPAHAAGPADVTLSCGTDSFTLSNAFTFIAFSHSVTGITPTFGSSAGGTLTSISGTDFQSNCWAFFDEVAAHHVTVSSGATILATAPAHVEGGVTVSVRCGGVSKSLGDAFTFTSQDDPSAVITSIDPLSGSAGQSVRLTGVRFRSTDRIAFNSTAATILSTAPDTQVVRIPELPLGKVSITLTDASGHATTTGPIFTTLEPQAPHIDSASPMTIAGGDELDLTGSGLRPGYTFILGEKEATIVELSYTHALVRAGDVNAGTYSIDILNAAGDLAAIGPSVECVAGGVSISGIAPACGSADGSVSVTISGNGFAKDATVTFGGTTTTDVTVLDAQTITAKTPAGAPGLARIVVTNGDGTRASLTDAFRYYSPMDPDGGCGTPIRRRSMH